MANLYNNPSFDPANNNNLAGTISSAFKKMIQKTDGMLPAQVISYDRAKNRVQVQLFIRIIKTDGSAINRPQIASIPVLLLGGGGFFLTFPIATGDLGWVFAADRDISNFLSTYQNAIPNTNRVKDFSSALFIPDIMTGYDVAEGADGAVSLQNRDGTVSVLINDNDVTINAADTVTINAENDVNINAGGNCIVYANSGTGVFAVSGNITASGTIVEGIPPPT